MKAAQKLGDMKMEDKGVILSLLGILIALPSILLLIVASAIEDASQNALMQFCGPLTTQVFNPCEYMENIFSLCGFVGSITGTMTLIIGIISILKENQNGGRV